MYVMAQSSELLLKLGIDLSDLTLSHSLDVFDATIGLWENQILDCVHKVYSRQSLFIRLPGITDCPRLDQLISDSKVSNHLSPSRQGQKRKANEMAINGSDELDSEAPASKRLFVDSSLRTSNPSALPASPITNTPVLTATASPPSSASMRWPQGLFAVDVALGLQRMETNTADTQEERFAAVFVGYRYAKATFQRHKCTWTKATVQEREAVLSLPRNAVQGSWNHWYKTFSGKPT